MAAQKQDDQLEHTFSSYVRIQVVVRKTYLGRWTIGRSGERGSGISVLPARYDDDDDEMTTKIYSKRQIDTFTFSKHVLDNLVRYRFIPVHFWSAATIFSEYETKLKLMPHDVLNLTTCICHCNILKKSHLASIEKVTLYNPAKSLAVHTSQTLR